jgi:hypothetical protein
MAKSPVKTGAGRKPATIAKTSTKAKAREGKKAVVGYFSPGLNQAMHDIAGREGTKIQALVGEAIDMLMVDRDMPPFKER